MKISVKKITFLIALTFLFLTYPTRIYSNTLDLKNCENTYYLLQHPHQVPFCAERILPTNNLQLNYLGKEKTTQYTQYKYSFASVV